MTASKPPMWFWITAGIGLLWNAIGVFAYIAQATASEAYMSQLTEAGQAWVEAYPAWATGVFAVAVFSGIIGCILLLLRKPVAKILLIVSLAAALIQIFYNFAISNGLEVFGASALVTPILVVLVGAYLIWLASRGIREGWIS